MAYCLGGMAISQLGVGRLGRLAREYFRERGIDVAWRGVGGRWWSSSRKFLRKKILPCPPSAAHLIQWCWKVVRRRYAAWTQAARVGATAGRAGAAEAAEEAAEAAAEEEELLLGCI